MREFSWPLSSLSWQITPELANLAALVGRSSVKCVVSEIIWMMELGNASDKVGCCEIATV